MVLFAAAMAAATTFSFKVESGGGLTVQAAGLPVVRGSWFQYYEPGWSKGYYSSMAADQRIEKLDDATYRVTYDAGNRTARGTQTYHAEGDHLKVHYEFDWDGDHPVKVEAALAQIWAPAFENGTLTADGKPTRALNAYTYSGPDLVARRFSTDAPTYAFTTSLGSVTEHSSQPLTLFDARGGYNQSWAEGHQVWWLGALGLVVEKDKPATLDVDWSFDLAAPPTAPPISETLSVRREDQVLLPDGSMPVLIPKPKTDSLDWDHPLQLTGAFTFPAGVFDHLDEFKAALARRFEYPAPAARTPTVEMDAGISKLGFVPGGYRITVRPNGITVLGEEDEGLRFGLERLASLAFTKDGKLYLPTGSLTDQPQADWRGVHLFVGPHAFSFQEDLWTRVLRPLGFNKVVLQCERTAWDSLHGIETSITMPKAQLVRLFAMYRNLGIDPIPLIESYGHMEWLFEKGKNLDAAMNPQAPYAIDPRKPQAQALLSKLWDEAITALKPDTVHFGLDEVDMIGFQEDPALETQLWKTQVGFLGDIARSHGVRMMLWGDQALAPGEAPDAALGDDRENAAARRDAIPKGSLIGDWHYLDHADYRTYTKVLQLWKSAGLTPIATAWYKPDNIHGFYADAGILNVGALQTTWAGYESSEEAMLNAMPQFTAMVLAADYAWSGRNEKVGDLGYDPAQVFRKLYFGRPSPLTPRPGFDLTSAGAEAVGFTIENVRYGAPLSLALSSILAPARPHAASELDLKVEGKGRELAVAMQTLAAADDGEPVADLTVTFQDGRTIEKRLTYGRQVRAVADAAPLAIADRDAHGVCSLRLQLGTAPVQVRSIRFHPLNAYTGLRILGLELID